MKESPRPIDVLRSNIRMRMKLMGISTDAELARRAGITKTYVSQLLNEDGGNDNPGLNQMILIANALDTTVGKLLLSQNEQVTPGDAMMIVAALFGALERGDSKLPMVKQFLDWLRERGL